MANTVTINLFEVSRTPDTQALSQTLHEFAQLPLEQRTRSDIRLDTVTLMPIDDVLPVEVWCLDFAKGRDVGPGKMARDKGVSDVGLGDDEFFGEETAALYVPNKKWLLVLNNHYGVGPSRMAAYFNALDPGNSSRHLMYSIAPKIDQAALKKMKAMKQFAEVELTASVGAFDETDGVGESVLEAASGISAQRVHLRFIANEKHKKGYILRRDAVMGLVDKLLQKSEDVDVLKIKRAEEVAEKQDRVINLIEHKIRRHYTQRDLTVTNHRYTYQSKIDLLRRACRGWLDSIV